MTNEYELADDNRQDLIYTKEQLLAPLLPGMEQPPHPMRLGDNEKDYYLQGRRRRVRGRSRCRRGARSSVTGRRRLCREHLGPRRGRRLLVPRHRRAGRRARHGARRNAVHSALLLVADDAVARRVLHREQAPFLGVVQIIVYTGAIMILFLFVLMLVGARLDRLAGRDVPRAAGRRAVLGIGFAVLVARASATPRRRRSRGLDAARNARGNVLGLAG